MHDDECEEPGENTSAVGQWLESTSAESPLSDLGRELNQDDCEQLFVHALLRSALEPEARRSDRISKTLDRFEILREDHVGVASDEAQASEQLPVTQEGSTKAVRGRRLVLASSLAASILAVCGLWLLVAPSSAEAAVSRALAATRESITRHYEGSVSLRILGQQKNSRVDFYSHSFDMFAAEFEDMSRKPFVIGCDGKKRWLVAGNWSWNSNSESELPRDVFLNRVTLRNLQFNQLLSRIPACYSVAFLEQTPLPGSESLVCQPIKATLNVNDTRLPETITLWPHPSTGVIHQIRVIRGEGKLAALRVEARLSDELEVSQEYFTQEFHIGR